FIEQTNANTFGGLGPFSLALDSNDNPHVLFNTVSGYVGHGNNVIDLKYAYANFNNLNIQDNVFSWTTAGILLASGSIIAVLVMVLMFNHRKNRKDSLPL
ncbi:MAG: hypothetical protein NWF01_04260, partial [Candidatus Bathyarchaeota archaeon]|nr:hypothetical protein [Candidatus Bathyarchaeota archaeon]